MKHEPLLSHTSAHPSPIIADSRLLFIYSQTLLISPRLLPFPRTAMARGLRPTVSFVMFIFFGTIIAAGAAPSSVTLDVSAALAPKSDVITQSGDADEEADTDTDTKSGPDGLRLSVLHRDAFHNASLKDIWRARLLRDAARVASLNRRLEGNGSYAAVASDEEKRYRRGRDFSSSIVSGLSEGSGEYFTRIGLGVPAKSNMMVLDTGSDLLWIQCKPCVRCYRQKDPLFDPAASSSFRHVRCGAALCQRLEFSGCHGNRYCEYQVSYGDGSFTVGDFSTETLTFRGRVVPRVAIGCGHDNEGLFVGAAGLLGLGRGALSLPSQTGPLFHRMFSYCLVDRDASGGASSALIFGPSAAPRSTVFTPMLTNPKMDTFYYVELVGLSVGGRRVRSAPASLFRLDAGGNGGVIIDCGTSVTRLVEPAYAALRDAFRAQTRGLRSASSFSLFDTCYDLSGLRSVKVPTVVLHFNGGADVSLPANNYLIPVDPSGIFCLAFAGTSGGLNIIGNIQQQGFRVVFDTQSERVGFAAASC